MAHFTKEMSTFYTIGTAVFRNRHQIGTGIGFLKKTRKMFKKMKRDIKTATVQATELIGIYLSIVMEFITGAYEKTRNFFNQFITANAVDDEDHIV